MCFLLHHLEFRNKEHVSPKKLMIARQTSIADFYSSKNIAHNTTILLQYDFIQTKQLQIQPNLQIIPRDFKQRLQENH
ncbi:hypothetical protein D3C80_1574080 [compost metagenome]